MNTKQKLITKINSVVTVLFLALYFLINFKKFVLTSEPRGDEHSFLEMYDVFLNQGFYEANVAGNSTLFNFISSLFYQLGFSPLYSLKCTSVLSGLATMVLLYYIGKRMYGHYNAYFQTVALLTSYNVIIVVIAMFGGINDPLLTVLLLAIVYILLKKVLSTKDFIYIGALLALMLATRKFTILFIPSLLFLLFVVLRKQSQIAKKLMYLAVSCGLLIGILNFPSLKENGTLSFHSKENKEYVANWAQLQYYTQLQVNEGKIAFGSHVTWQDTDEYLAKNGENSLPKGIISGLLFDVKLTVKEFFIDFFYNAKSFTRLLGIIFILNIIIFGFKLIRRKLSIQTFINNPIDTFGLIYTLILSLIVISYVEIRWFIPILTILSFVFMKRIHLFTANFKNAQRNNFLILNAQLIALNVMSLPLIIKNFTQIL
ncbi:MAG: glycosyltransferase family 39 protein [Bacteroidota bacterium]